MAMMMTREPKAKEQYYIVVLVVRSSAARTNCDYTVNDDDNGYDVITLLTSSLLFPWKVTMPVRLLS